MLTLPANFMELVMQNVSEQISKPGFSGIAIVAIGLVGTFFVIEMIIGHFQKARRGHSPRIMLDDDMEPGAIGRSFDRKS